MTSNIPGLRTDLARRQIDHQHLTDVEVFHLSCVLRGWHVTPRAAAGARPIAARVWLAAALATGGRYRAPDVFGHPADLGDGGEHVDSVVLMAIVQRHFLPLPALAWDDDALAPQIGVDADDIARAQVVLDDMHAVVPRGAPPLGVGWWERESRVT